MFDPQRVTLIDPNDEKKSDKVLIHKKTAVEIEEEIIKQKDEVELVECDLRTDVDKALETVLEEVGPFGRYQKWTAAVVALVLVLLAASGEFNFTAARINTRCFIPECEDAGREEFSPPWLRRALPPVEEWSPILDSCRRFANTTNARGSGYCYAAYFDRSRILSCEQFVYENNHTVVFDFELGCSEWPRSAIGASRAVGAMLSAPLAERATRRWGRRGALLLGAALSGGVGALRSLAPSYRCFLGSQLVEAAVGAGTHSNAIYLALELVGPAYSNMLYAGLVSCLALGQAWMALLAWLLPRWRLLTLALYLPQLLVLPYLWTLDESLRWHLRRGRFERAGILLKKVARTNGSYLSEKSLLSLRAAAEADRNKVSRDKTLLGASEDKQVLVRYLVLPLWWTAAALVSSGLIVNSVYIPGSAHAHYAAVAFASVAGIWATYLLRAAPRKTMLRSFWICGVCQILYCFVGIDNYWAGLTLYLASKASIVVAQVAAVTVSAELVAGSRREWLPLLYYRISQVGGVAAALTPALGYELKQLQFLLFGILTLLCSCLSPLVPETNGIDDTTSAQDQPNSASEQPNSANERRNSTSDQPNSARGYPTLASKYSTSTRNDSASTKDDHASVQENPPSKLEHPTPTPVIPVLVEDDATPTRSDPVPTHGVTAPRPR